MEKLNEVLQKQGCYENSRGMELRRETLKHLNTLVSSWIQSVSLDRGMPWQVCLILHHWCSLN